MGVHVSLDIRTQIIVLAVTLLAGTFALLMTWRVNRRVPGLELWALGYAVYTFGFFLMAGQQYLSPWASVVLANILVVGASYVLWSGTRSFMGGLPGHWGLLIVSLLFVGLGLGYVVATDMNFPARIIIATAPMVLINVLMGFAFLKRIPQDLVSARFLAGLSFFHATALAIRIGYVAYAQPTGMLPDAGWFESCVFLEANLLAVLFPIGLIVLMTERLQFELRQQAAFDPLTGIFNRRAFFEAANPVLARGVRQNQPATLLMIDIDHFKAVNDTYGHGAGDMILEGVAEIVSKALREQDILARFGGEEFIALLPNAGLDQAVVVAERVRKAVAVHSFDSKGGHASVSVSIGVGGGSCSETPLSQYIESADMALYRAKSDGRNCVRVSDTAVLKEKDPKFQAVSPLDVLEEGRAET